MKTIFITLCFTFFTTNVFAAEFGFIGTEESPNPLTGTYQQIPYTLFFNENGTYRIMYGDSEIMVGDWTDTEESVSFRPDGIANKVFISSNGNTSICLQATFYSGPEEFRFIADIFCPMVE